MNYVFVDYENVHEVDLQLIGARSCHLTILLGAHQNKLAAELVEQLLLHASCVQLVRLEATGRNAVDFALAYYLGKTAQVEPSAYFHIISKDAGFDPLIQHLKSRQINVRRHENYAELTALLTPKSTPVTTPLPTPDAAPDLLTRVIAHLQKSINNRPKSKKALVTHLTKFCGNSATEAEVTNVIANLVNARHVTIDAKDKVTYP